MEYAQMLCLARSIFKNEKAATDWASDNGYRCKQAKHTDRDYVFVQRRASLFMPGTFHREPVRIDGVVAAGVAVILGTTRRTPVLRSKGDRKRNAKKRINNAEKRMAAVSPEEQRTLIRNVLKSYGAGLDSGEIADALQIRGNTATAMLKVGIDTNFASWSKANYRDNWVRYVAFHMNLIAELEMACAVFMEDPESKQYTALVTARKAQAEIHDRIFERGTALGIIEVRTPEARIEPSDKLSMLESLRTELTTLANLISEIEIEQERTTVRVKVRMSEQAEALAKATGEPAPMARADDGTFAVKAPGPLVKGAGVRPDSPAIEVVGKVQDVNQDAGSGSQSKPEGTDSVKDVNQDAGSVQDVNRSGSSGSQSKPDATVGSGSSTLSGESVEAELASELELERAGLND